jgi:hypothetical protein
MTESPFVVLTNVKSPIMCAKQTFYHAPIDRAYPKLAPVNSILGLS